MLNDRTRGLLTLHTLVVLVVLTGWFAVFALLLDKVFGFDLLLHQINFVVYALGIAAALLLANAFAPRDGPRSTGAGEWVDVLRQTNRQMLTVALVILAIIWATKDKAISRQFVAGYMGTSWVLLVLLNRHLYGWIARVFFSGRDNVASLLIGSGAISQKLQRWMAHQEELGVNVMGIVTPTANTADMPPSIVPVLGDVSQLDAIIERTGAGQLILMERSRYWLDAVIEAAHRHGCRLLIFNHWEEHFQQPLTVVAQGELTFFTLGEEPLQNPLNRIVKRVIDVCVALPMVLLALPPLTLLVWLVQRMQSPGPVLYRQVRTGHGQRLFRIYKFRTLNVGDGPADARRFPFGNFLRRTSLDEIPQFINVLQGHMSVVGPRPHNLADDALFARFTELYRDRHFVKPGITGLAQQMGYRGEVLAADDLERRIQYDLEYIRNWSPLLDIGIILRTTLQVFLPPRGAR